VPFKRFDQARPFLALGIVVGAWLLVPVAIKTFTRATFFEMQAPVSVAASYARDLQEYWTLRLHSNSELIEAGRDLARLNASYALGIQRNTELEADIKRLESLLGLPAFPGHRSEHARVARGDFSGWWQRLIIRKGKNSGIPVGAPVVFSGGAVGRVAEVHATTAVIELITSPNFRLAAIVEGDTRPISFQGGVNPTFGSPRAVVDYVPLDVNTAASAPRRLVTSGLGGVFPAGLHLGEIIRLERAGDGLFQTGEVKLDGRLAALTEVTVLVPVQPEIELKAER
jgi:rod shape-determining protein MreC